MTMKKLSINANPRMRTYTYHAFFGAIVSSEEKVSNIAAKVYVNDFSHYQWTQQKDELICSVSDNLLIFETNKWNTGMNHCFWRECHEYDEIEINIEKQLYSSSWGAINVFVTKDSQTDMLDDDEYTYRLGNFCKSGVYVRIENNHIPMPIIVVDTPFTLMLRREKNKYSSILRKDDQEYKLNEWELEDDRLNSKRIGFEIKLNHNVFYEWHFSNYIQICQYVNTSEIPIDYLYNSTKNWGTYTTNYFVDYNINRSDLILKYGLSVLEFVKASIDMKQYIEMWINENYIDKITDAKPHIHQNLIYGYDDETRELLILHMNMGIPQQVTMKYEEFLAKDNYSDEHRLVIATTYNPDYNIYELQPTYLVYILKKYLDSSDMTDEIQHCLMKKNCVWGMDTLSRMLTKKGLLLIGKDIRVSHLLYERAICMEDRIEYLIARKILTQEEKECFAPYITKAVNITSAIRNIVIRSRIRPSMEDTMEYYEKIKALLLKLISCENEYIPILIKILEQKQ